MTPVPSLRPWSRRRGRLATISLRRCRELIGPSELTDEEVLALRDQLYDLAGVVVPEYETQRSVKTSQSASMRPGVSS